MAVPSSGSGLDAPALSASERRIRRLVAEFERSLRESFPKENEPTTLEQIEQLTDRIGEEIKDHLQRDVIEQQSSGFSGSRICCSGRGRANGARHRGTQSRDLVTLHGPVSIVRSYYHCCGCGKGFCPLDRQFGIGSGQLSALVVCLLSRFACYLSFREAARELEIVCGVRLSHSTITRHAAAVGQQWGSSCSRRTNSVGSRCVMRWRRAIPVSRIRFARLTFVPLGNRSRWMGC